MEKTLMRGDWCRVCGNEMTKMGSHRLGCIFCYASTGPDWTARWLSDCTADENISPNVVVMAEWLKQKTPSVAATRSSHNHT